MDPHPLGHQRQPGWLMPLALGAIGLLALLTGLLLAMVLRGQDRGVGAASPTPTSLSSSSPSPQAASPSDATPSATPPASADEAVVLENRVIAEVTTDVLNLRAGPGTDSELRFALTTGRRVFVIGQPQTLDGLRWYRVGVLSSDTCDEDCGGIGWVATPVSGDQWLAAADVNCPGSPLDATDPAGLQALELLHCFGRQEIQVTGTVDTPCCGWVGPFVYSPEWLATPTAPRHLRAGSVGFGFRHNPENPLALPERGDVVRVTGHFEDPAASECRVRAAQDYEGEVGPLGPDDQAQAVLDCRATFVWTSYEVVGHEELGPCCGVRGPGTGRHPAALPPLQPTRIEP